jgi:hypothetical protein
MSTTTARLVDGPYDGREVGNSFSSPAVIRCAEGAYGHDLRAAAYRWYPLPARLDPLPCETEVNAADLFGADLS